MAHWVDRVFPYFATLMNFLWSATLFMEMWSQKERVGSKFCALIARVLNGAG
jgi:hypothetical protein